MERDESNRPKMNYHDGQNLPIQLTSEELAILSECQFNSIVHRGLPIGAATIGSIYYLAKMGIIKKNRYTVSVGGFLGFIFGTMSYRRVCMDKLMALPNSTLKERILNAQKQQPHVRVEVQSGNSPSSSWFDNATPPEQPPMTSSLDIEPYNQSHRFDDLSTRPIDAETAYAIDPPLQPISGTPYATYDDLRRRNREQYEKTRNDGFRIPDRPDTMGRQPIDPRSSPYERADYPTSKPPPSQDFWP